MPTSNSVRLQSHARKFTRVATSLNLDRIFSRNETFLSKFRSSFKTQQPERPCPCPKRDRAGTRNEVEAVTERKDTQRERMEFPRNPGSSDIMRHRTPGRDGPRTKKKKRGAEEAASRKSDQIVPPNGSLSFGLDREPRAQRVLREREYSL